jgi:hypothetical protein
MLVVCLILGFFGLRDDYTHAMPGMAIFWKPGIFFLVWLGSMWMIADVSRPNGTIRKRHVLPLILSIGLLCWQLVRQVREYPLPVMMQSVQDKSALFCLPIILTGGAITLAVMWKCWFVKTASPRPTLLGFLGGLSAGALATTAYALQCNRDSVFYILLYYGLPILILSLVGYIAGRNHLRW